MTPSELHLAMTSGFSTISGSVLIGYINLGVPASSLVTASIMSIPASIAISKIVYPEDDHPVTLGRLVVDRGEETSEEANMVSRSHFPLIVSSSSSILIPLRSSLLPASCFLQRSLVRSQGRWIDLLQRSGELSFSFHPHFKVERDER